MEISAKKGYEQTPFMVAQSFNMIYFDNVTLTNFTSPTIYTKNQGEIVVKDSSSILVQQVDDIDKYL